MVVFVYQFLLYWLACGTLALVPISGWLQRARRREPAEAEGVFRRH